MIGVGMTSTGQRPLRGSLTALYCGRCKAYSRLDPPERLFVAMYQAASIVTYLNDHC